MARKIDPNKSAEENLYTLISSNNSGLEVNSSKVTLGTPTPLSTPIGSRDTELPLTAVNNKGFSGTSKVRYNRLQLDQNVANAPKAFNLLNASETFDNLKARICKAWSIIPTEVVFNNGQLWTLPTDQGSSKTLSIQPKAGSLVYNGDLINLSITLPVPAPGYADFVRAMNDIYGPTRSGVGEPWSTRVASGAYSVGAGEGIMNSRTDGIRFDSIIEQVMRIPSIPAAVRNDYYANKRVFGITLGRTFSLNGYQWVDAPILYYWDEANQRGVRMDNPLTDTPTSAPLTLATGEAVFTTEGTTQWTVPDGVYQISTVLVGAGGAWRIADQRAGAGGSLCYRNMMAVTPGEVLTINVGYGQYNTDSNYPGDSSISRGTTQLIVVTGSTNTPGTWTGADAGFSGGRAGTYGGGGGAAGYSGKGGDGSGMTNGLDGAAGTGGGASGGAAIGYSSSSAGSGGGGVGLEGEGASGAASVGNSTSTVGRAGSGGDRGRASESSMGGAGGRFGGGIGAPNQGNGTSTGVRSGQGGVRIIWGAGRSFPKTKTTQAFSAKITLFGTYTPVDYRGEILITKVGRNSIVVPAGVTKLHGVLVSGGSAGTLRQGSGAGGSLAWKNGIPVTPGETLFVDVGPGGAATLNDTNNYRTAVYRGDTLIFAAEAPNGVTPGALTNADGGGLGGVGTKFGNGSGGGGGGAGGYAGNGGTWADGTNGGATDGKGGAAGGGAQTQPGNTFSNGGGGGGVGLYGQGANGTGGVSGTNNNHGKGGSGGDPGKTATDPNSNVAGASGGAFGGGAGGPLQGYNNNNTVVGGQGAARLVWGKDRSFPSTNVNEPYSDSIAKVA